jgi:hypothetical protein
MAIHWQVKFKSLRAGTDYTVNIYDENYSGNPIPLKGGAEPFVTQEDDDEDMFAPIRTQSGYIRIVDDGLDANGNAWDWKTLLPSTDTDRPITLTDGNTVVWQGFMQSQNFGSVLYGNPQEREFPVQCPLSVLEGTDINFGHTEIENFSYLLQRVVNTVDVVSGGTENSSGVITSSGSIHINNIYVQGNADAQQWLLKRIDWQNFADEDSDGNIIARFNLYQCLEDLCRFWGWTARTYRNNVYLTCADDSTEQLWLTLTRANLDTMAIGTSAGTIDGAFSTLDYDMLTDIFASTGQDDYRQRGANKATVKADCNTFDETIYESFPNNTVKKMEDGGWQGYTQYGDVKVNYTYDKYSFTTFYFSASAVSGNASFNLARFIKDNDPSTKSKVIRILKTYNGTPFVSLDSRYSHLFVGYLKFNASIFQRGVKYEEDRGWGLNKSIKIAVGIGKTRSTAKWYNGTYIWSNTKTVVDVSVGYSDNAFRFLFANPAMTDSIGMITPLEGHLFVDIYGSNDLDEFDGQRLFDLGDMNITYNLIDNGDSFLSPQRITSNTYRSSNSNNVRDEWNADCIYASYNNNSIGAALLINPSGSNTPFVNTLSYNGGMLEHPEQHLADRVTTYWATAKRKLATELRADKITEPSPMNKVKLDSTIGHPIAISHVWRDDVIQLTILEL